MWKFLGKRPFFRADLAGLGKYRTGGFGRIGVYRDMQHDVLECVCVHMYLIGIYVALDLLNMQSNFYVLQRKSHICRYCLLHAETVVE